jgi:hypothetical protein
MDSLQAEEQLESLKSINENNIKSLVYRATKDAALADKVETQFLMSSMKSPKHGK